MRSHASSLHSQVRLLGQEAGVTDVGPARVARDLRRLAIVLTVGFAVALLPFLVSVLADPSPEAIRRHLVSWGTWAVVAAGSTVVWIASRRFTDAIRVRSLGLAYGVLGAMAMSFSEAWDRFSLLTGGDEPFIVPGISWVCLWVAAISILVPAPLHALLVANLLSASTGPLMAALDALAHPDQIPAGGLPWVLLYWPNLVAALGSAAMGATVHRLREDVQKVREMGAYKLVRRLGRGGMGEVWQAEHRLLARPAAVKVIRPETLDASSPDATARAMARFEREAKATAQLRSSHTIEVYDFGISQEGAFYYVMELLDGLPLDELVERHGPLPPERAVHVLRQICYSLADAHDHGMVHRDVKPANIFLCAQGGDLDFVKVLDFGLVKTHATDDLAVTSSQGGALGLDSALTREGAITGTPAFMAPEQIDADAEVDHRADIYALGCVAYWLLAGRQVFDAPHPLQVCANHLLQPPDLVSMHVSGKLPEGLEELVMGCLAKAPSDRPQSAHEVVERLDLVGRTATWSRPRAHAWWRDHREQTPSTPATVAFDETVGELDTGVPLTGGADTVADADSMATDMTVDGRQGES